VGGTEDGRVGEQRGDLLEEVGPGGGKKGPDEARPARAKLKTTLEVDGDPREGEGKTPLGEESNHWVK